MNNNTLASIDESAVLLKLADNGYGVSLLGFSAIDRYLGLSPLPCLLIETDADISGLARLFEELRFPGLSIADCALRAGNREYLFRSWDPASSLITEYQYPAFKLLSFSQSWPSRRYRDPADVYPLLRLFLGKTTFGNGSLAEGNTAEENPYRWWEDLWPGTTQYRALMDGALIAARYYPETGPRRPPIEEIAGEFRLLDKGVQPKEEEQRLLLTGLLSSPRPDLGLELLKSGGFVKEFWPELAALDEVDHSKEFHPEGNGWNHTLETFRYRKGIDNICLSLGLLLHDVGKSRSGASGQRRFDGHAELGVTLARRFLTRLGFEAGLTEDVSFLVRNHMFPAALPRLPLATKKEILESDLFPALMELYRCDESSSFKGLDAYYESSAVYRSYLRNSRNPYRRADGKKITP